jgi:hypothetical protein
MGPIGPVLPEAPEAQEARRAQEAPGGLLGGTNRTGDSRITPIALWTRGTWRPCRPPKPIATT